MRITGSGDPTLQFERISGGSTLYSVSFNGVTLNMGSITVSSCTGCSTLAEMMQVSGVEEGDAVCISAVSGAFERCGEDSSLAVVGIATTHAEQILNLGCGTGNNKLMLGGNAQDWRHAGCEGWFPVALEGVHEFTKVRCFRSDGSPLEFGDRLVTASDGRLRPLSGREAGGDAVVARAKTVCSSGEETGVIQAVLR
ncbi:hypothetical protein C4580_03355 [Candidatus Woesearchaeota archaeon]|nr:MAG: hypothetical protein C4580_03355 [Candidatus Woesearchaeota archaeon]